MESISQLGRCKSYARASLFGKNGELKVKGLLDTGNSVLEETAISENLHKRLGVGLSDARQTTIGTAKEGAQLQRMGTSNPIKMKITGMRQEFCIRPTVVRDLSDDLNLGDRFLDTIASTKGQKCQIIYDNGRKKLTIGPETSEMIRVMAPVTEEIELEESTRGRTLMRTPAMERAKSVNQRNPRLTASQKTIIPAHSLKFMKVKTQRPLEQVDILVEAGDSVYTEVPTAIYRWEGQEGRIAVLNLCDEDVEIPENKTMGYYSGVTEQERDDKIKRMETQDSDEDPESRVKRLQDEAVQKLGIYSNKLLKANPKVRDKVVEMVKKYYKVFGEPGLSIGKTDLVEFKIDLKPDAKPIRQKLRPLNPVQVESLKNQLKEWEDNDCIQPSKSPYASPMVGAWKKGNKIRWAIDYRALNQQTIADSYPVPNIETNLEKLAGAKYFSCLDAASAYQTVPVEEKTRPLLAFVTPFGLYEFTRMPFGPTNAVATYCRFVEMLLSRLNSPHVIGYLDDILVFTDQLDKHADQLEKVLAMHEMAGIKLRPEKTKLFQEEAEYLGFVVNKDGIMMHPDYVKAIQDWPEPETVKELNTFLGYSGYYRSFLKDYSELTYEMNQQRRAKTLEWTKQMSENFKKIKEAFMKRPIRSYPRYDIEAPFEVTTDFSAKAVGAILSQVQNGRERFLGSVARKTTKFEANYGSVKGELAAVMMALRRWEHLLRYKPFVLNTDSAALKYLKTLKDPRGIWFRWIHELSGYNFEVVHRAGKKNTNADALSRSEHHREPTKEEEDEQKDEFIQAFREFCVDDLKTQIAKVEADNPRIKRIHRIAADLTKETLITEQKNDPVLSQVREWIEKDKKPTKKELDGEDEDLKSYLQILEALNIEDDLLIYRTKLNQITGEEARRIVVPRSYIRTVFYWSHEHETAGHFGINATSLRAQRRFYYPGMMSDMKRMVMQCKACLAKITKANLKRGVHVPAKNGYPLETVYIDLVGPLPATIDQYKYILTIEDGFTRMAWAYPLKNKEGTTVARVFLDNFICRYGMPQRVHSDNGKEFVNKIMEELMDRLRVDKTTTPTYNPNSNIVERLHRTLNQTMRVFMERDETQWNQYLPGFLMAYNTKVNASTGFTPHYAFFGREMRLPVDLVLPAPTKTNLNQHVNQLLDRITKMYSYIRQNNEAVIRRNAAGYQNAKFNFKVGDKVMYLSPRKFGSKPGKITDQWIGPYTVIRRISDVLYRIKPTHFEGPSIAVHVARLIDAKQRTVGHKNQVPSNLALDAGDDDLAEEIRLPRDVTTEELGVPVTMSQANHDIGDLNGAWSGYTPRQRNAVDYETDSDSTGGPTQQMPASPVAQNTTQHIPATPLSSGDESMGPGRADSLEEVVEPMPGPSRVLEPTDQIEPMPPLIKLPPRPPRPPPAIRQKRKKTMEQYLDQPSSGSETESQVMRRRSKRRSLLKQIDNILDGSSSEGEMKKITVAIDHSSIVPTRGTQKAAAVDLYAAEKMTIPPGATVSVPLKLKMAIPDGMCMLVLSRSGLAKKGLVVQGGLIDEDYRGEVFAILHNNDRSVEYKLQKGERCAQGIFLNTETDVEFVPTDICDPKYSTQRGTGGFGSTGNF